MLDDTEELYYWLTTRPTIAEVRRLNRESFLLWPLSVLSALVEGGVDLDAHPDAILRQVVVETDDCIDLRIRARGRSGRVLADLGVDADGEYFAFWRRWCSECLARERCPNCTGSF